MHLPNHLRHATHSSEPDVRCEVCVAKAADALRGQGLAGVPVRSTDQVSVRAVGGFVQESGRFVR